MANNVNEDERTKIVYHSKIKGVTKGKALKLTYEWEIYNINIIGKKLSECLSSEKFWSLKNAGIRWQLNLYPKGRTTIYEQMAVYLKFYPSRKYREIEAAFEIYFLDKENKKLFYSGTTHFFTQINCERGITYPNNGHDFRNYLNNDYITLICEITYCTDVVNFPNELYEIPNFIDSNFCKLQSGYKTLFNSQQLTDVILTASGKELHAHKAILAAHSPVFLAMFDNDMKEKSNNRVDIPDLDFNILQEMVRFIYTREVKNMSAIVGNLLIASDKYDVEALKNQCEQYLCKKLNVDNVLESYRIADQYNALVLKKYADQFIRFHLEQLCDKNEMELLIGKAEANLTIRNTFNSVFHLCFFVTSGIIFAVFLKKLFHSSSEQIVTPSPILQFDGKGNIFSRFL